MKCLANTGSFDHAHFKIVGFSYTKVGPRHSTPPNFFLYVRPCVYDVFVTLLNNKSF